MATTFTEKLLLGTATQIMTTQLNSLASNGLALGGAFDNTIGQTGDGYTLCDFELYVSAASAMASNSAFYLWLLASLDGTNYEDGDASTQPARNWDLSFPLRAASGAQRINRRRALMWGKWKPLLMNAATGQTIASTGNILSVRPVTHQLISS